LPILINPRQANPLIKGTAWESLAKHALHAICGCWVVALINHPGLGLINQPLCMGIEACALWGWPWFVEHCGEAY